MSGDHREGGWERSFDSGGDPGGLQKKEFERRSQNGREVSRGVGVGVPDRYGGAALREGVSGSRVENQSERERLALRTMVSGVMSAQEHRWPYLTGIRTELKSKGQRLGDGSSR